MALSIDVCESVVVDELDDELLGLLQEHAPAGSVIHTLSNRRPNWITDVTRQGVFIETERSRARGVEPHLVPAWMIQVAWSHLRDHGSLTNVHLVASDGLNVKRSAAVCALLSVLPMVEVSSNRPILLVLA
ncbi:MAG TPA: hypothetical protein GX718_11550 [Brevibacterium sp.]|nr:hypothetical protein [Brevibacterium sp.]